MYGYRQLISEKNFLKVRLRARMLMHDGSDLVAILYKDRRLLFRTASGTYGKRVIWAQTIEITDALLENILAGNSFHDVETLIRESSLKVHCDCPAFHYWGFKYKAWKKGYGLQRELRRPHVRNPYEKGFVCKHLYLVLSLYPFWSKAIAKKFKSWADSKEGAMNTQRLQNLTNPRMNASNRRYAEGVRPSRESLNGPVPDKDESLGISAEPNSGNI